MQRPEDDDDSRLIPAASVILLRPTADGRGLETLMLRRGNAVFAAFVWVFPGGAVDPTDADPALFRLADGLDPNTAHARIGGTARRGPLTPAASFGVWVAGVREVFEEVGIAFITGPDGALLRLNDPATAARWESYRADLLAEGVTLADVLQREEARLALDRLTYYSHWITPKMRSRRYNTFFFLAVAPPHQPDRHHPAEAEESCWITPAEALARHDRGDFPLISVTRAHLQRLAEYGTIETMLAHAATKRFPAVEARIIPGNDGSSLVRERLDPEVADCW